MEHSSTLLDGIYDYLTCTLLNRSFASNAICCKIALKWLKSQKVKIPLRHPKKWWPPICTKIGPQIVESPKFHINTLLWTFFSQKAFKSEFESRVPFRSVKLDAHSASRFYNYESSMGVCVARAIHTFHWGLRMQHSAVMACEEGSNKMSISSPLEQLLLIENGRVQQWTAMASTTSWHFIESNH